MGWFLANGHGAQSWNRTWDGTIAHEWMKPDFFVDMARSLERACFDFMMFEDSLIIPDTYGGDTAFNLKHGHRAPKNDPASIIPVLGYTTKNIGLVSTLSTTFYHPFHLARLAATLDHMTDGRFGWNIVTTSNPLAAANYGIELPPHDERYDIADEFVELAEKLWASWEPDSVVMDEETGVFIDHTKVNPVHHEGRYFKSRGPLNTQPSPQGRPVYVQAGGSGRGRQFAAEHAEAIVCMAKGVEAMKAFREDVTRRMVEAGRDPKSCKVLFLFDPVVGEDATEVRSRVELRDAKRLGADGALTMSGYSDTSGIDFSKVDLDEPLENLRREEGHLAVLEQLLQVGSTLREVLPTLDMTTMDVAGTPDQVAGQMEEIMQEVGGDGFLISGWEITRRRVAEIADGLAPALKRRGLIRDGYTKRTFREHLLEY
jgi:FMN-dependent oxidoreductase (nitrilotriacetate monooxygenase family)